MSTTKPMDGSRQPLATSARNVLPEDGWLLLIYRVPPGPSNNRVSVWRELKRMGALFLQQCVCIVPASPACRQGVQAVITRLTALGGTYNTFRVRDLEPDQASRLVEGFRRLAAKEYAEILEECRTKFVKEIEFERFRENYTYEEAEEIREDLEKIRRWYGRVVERDWFDTGTRDEVAAELDLCERMLEEFEADVYHRTGDDHEASPPDPSLSDPPAPGPAAPADGPLSRPPG